jgi:hypothetical protein
MLPNIDEKGNLPPGIYQWTLAEILRDANERESWKKQPV